jgi:hypothetical protein
MDTILPSGLPRYNVANITDNIKFENQSVIIGEFAGKDIKTNPTATNYFNTFIGYKAGQNSVSMGDTILLGSEAGMNVYRGSNLIVLGREETDGTLVEAFNMLSVGFFNKTLTNSISVGSYNKTNGYMSLSVGKLNTTAGDHNITLGHNIIYDGSENVHIGTNNIIANSDSSLVIGNNITGNEINNAIVIGNNISLDNAKSAMMIGNNLLGSEGVLMNIDNSIIKTNEGLYLGISTESSNIVPVCIGFSTSDAIPVTSNNYSLYTRNGAYFADRLTIGSFTLIAGSGSGSEMAYVLPDVPNDVQDTTNYALSLNNDTSNNVMVWKKLYQNTDELPQGNKNLYYNDSQVDARVEAKFHEKFNPYFDIRLSDTMSTITLDRVTNGINNKMIVGGKYDGDLSISGRLNANHLIVNKIEVLGYGGNTDWMSSSTSGLSTLNAAVTDLTSIISSTSNQLVNALNALANRVSILESKF